MKLAIMQPYLFPYIGYFQVLHAVDRFVIYDDVTFIKQGWVNRNRMLINRQAAFFTVPLKGASSFRLISDIEIDDGPKNAKWRAKLLKTFDNAYRRAPQFSLVFPLIDEVFSSRTSRIADLARASIDVVARYLGVTTPCVTSSTTHDNAQLSGQERVIDTCQAESADVYINSIGGRTLYTTEAFQAHGITLRFLRPLDIEYRQFGDPFVPSLSIVDVLMFNPRAKVCELLDQYELV